MPIGSALLLATQAVSLIKQGCALYKDIKGAAGNVKEIYDDINKQFSGKKVSKEQAAEITKEKQRVAEIANTSPDDVIGRIGDQLGAFFDAFDRIEDLFWQEEQAAKKVYTGDVSVSRRALQRVLIRSRLQAMYAEIRTEMTWNTPPELGDLWTRFSEMREQVLAEQEQARKEKANEERAAAWQREKLILDLQDKAIYAAAVLLVMVETWALLMAVATTRT